MTPTERKTAFDKLFESLPGKNVEKIRAVAEALYCQPNTVRIWRMQKPTRVIPESKLKMLQRHFSTT
jgi:hypothetical protein